MKHTLTSSYTHVSDVVTVFHGLSIRESLAAGGLIDEERGERNKFISRSKKKNVMIETNSSCSKKKNAMSEINSLVAVRKRT